MEILDLFIHIAHAATEAVNQAASSGAVESAAQAATQAANHASETDPGVVGMFGLNWKLFIAQLINFAIVLFVLWKWVFNPLINNLGDRTKKIEQSLADAKKIAEEKETFESWKENEISSVRKEASDILSQAKKDATTLKEKLLAETKAEQNKIIDQSKIAIAQEKESAIREIKSEIADLVVASTEKIIKAKLDSKTDEKLIDDAIKNMGARS